MFIAYEVALELVRALQRVIERIAARDGDLADQLRRAATSVVLNIAEGRGRRRADQARFYRNANGSRLEVIAALDVAAAWRFVDANELDDARAIASRLGALLWRLIH